MSEPAKSVLRLVIGALIGVVLTLGLPWAASGSQPETPVAEQWNDAIKRLSIEPVYPPVEDIVVGDVLAMITEDATEDIQKEAFAGRSIKLLHLDLTPEIQQAYQNTYQFPQTGDRPANDRQFWAQTLATESLFKPPEARKSLPLVVFPGFRIVRTRGASAGAGGLSWLWNSTFGAAASSSEVMDVKIAAAETYGVPAMPAEERLLGFCTHPSTEYYCSDAGVRQQLSIIVGAKIYDKIRDKETQKERPRFSVEIALVARVFLTRLIETSIHRANAITGEVNSTQPSPPSTPKGAEQKDSEPAPLSRQLQEQHNSIAGNSPQSRGVSASIQSGSSSDVILQPIVLPRPVVIGFKSVRWMPEGGP